MSGSRNEHWQACGWNCKANRQFSQLGRRSTSDPSAEYIVTEIKRHKRRLTVALAVLLLAGLLRLLLLRPPCVERNTDRVNRRAAFVMRAATAILSICPMA